MATLFISDLHLDTRRPAIVSLFLDFLQRQALEVEALYILGDLFEVWIGDDDDAELGNTVAQALQNLTQQGVPVYLMHGNRDFLIGQRFAATSGVQLLPETLVIDLYGTPTLLMHGDTLCTDDIKYQTFRAQVRSSRWQAQMLSRPLEERRLFGQQLRQESQQAVADKSPEITDVNPHAVIAIMRALEVYQLIHGHTHRPAVHSLVIDQKPACRMVLGDWYGQGSVLVCDAKGCTLQSLPMRS
ncbi:MAG: UDP-2,3-diacylglucosamine diphosphatase [Candidatus Competibacteraceae bacterium]|jgi:UDP-2,3-diacylglucosamine hydrolase|nr:UDP-2,3-diacylglucosamine diphosphatase [Candidatus Competibacteraceae bacterium]